jgi:GAF domain-containing protein
MLLQPMLQRLADAHGPREILDVALHDVMALLGAERGDIQLVGADGALAIVAQRNLPGAFVRAFARVAPDPAAVCARAMASRESVFVRDISQDAAFAPYLTLARSVPFTSVLSVPLVDAQQRCVGVLSVHSASRFDPTPLELDSIRRYASELLDAIRRAAGRRELPALAEQLAPHVLDEATRGEGPARRA